MTPGLAIKGAGPRDDKGAAAAYPALAGIFSSPRCRATSSPAV